MQRYLALTKKVVKISSFHPPPPKRTPFTLQTSINNTQGLFYMCFLLDKYERKRSIAYLFFFVRIFVVPNCLYSNITNETVNCEAPKNWLLVQHDVPILFSHVFLFFRKVLMGVKYAKMLDRIVMNCLRR